MLMIFTNNNFNSTLFNLIINSNKLTSTPYKFSHSIVINPKDLPLVQKIAKRNSLKILDSFEV